KVRSARYCSFEVVKAHYTRGASEKDAEEAIRKMVDFSTTARSPRSAQYERAPQNQTPISKTRRTE
ncbi:MAG: hypothetical protein WCQ21_20570, partial [Verrucomicrobiota bacterium]